MPGRGYQIPGFGLLPFGTNRFDNGSLILFPLEPDRPMLGTIEYGWTRRRWRRAPMTLDELRDSLRRLLGVDVPVEAPRRPGRMRCAVSTGRTRDRPSITAPGGCCLSAMPRTCTRRWAVLA